MKIRLADHFVKRLFELGQSIDIGQPVNVHDGGEVSLGNCSEEKDNDDERQGSRGPAAGSRTGAEGSRGSPGKARNPLGRIWPDWLNNDGLAQLLGSYPGSQVSRDDDGAWLRVPVTPLGKDGPEAVLVVALPKCRAIHPRCWAFWIEAPRVRLIGPRHTNYPFGDACAFPQFAGYWERRDGIRSYIDIHAEWMIRQLYYAVFERWVGRQMAPFALYALNQFDSLEQCHCGSGNRYGECCQPQDFGEWRSDTLRQVSLALKFTQWGWFNSQSSPREIVRFALGGIAPGFAQTYRLFKEVVRFRDRARIFKRQLLRSTASAGLAVQSAPLRIAA